MTEVARNRLQHPEILDTYSGRWWKSGKVQWSPEVVDSATYRIDSIEILKH